jgi:hypothetical protein
MSLTRIVAVVIDTTMFTCYLPDGKTIGILQGDPRTRKLLEALPMIESQGHADVDLSQANPYRDFESQVGGAIRFFRVLRTKLNEVFDEMEKVAPLFDPEVEAVPAASVGTIPQAAPAEPSSDPAAPADEEPAQPAAPVISDEKKAAAVAEIMANAQPASDPNFARDTQPSETVVAVLPDNSIIPDAEKVEAHLAHSVKIGSTKGMEAFLARLSKVIGQRKHSVEDVQRFMERNDLPIADDGSLIVYKVLRRGKNGGYVDCYTGKVSQKIGSLVQVDEKLIDLNRRNECSSGLHVARRGYVGQFNGDVCTLVKVAPEDVYTVPHGDPNKVRVRAYHVIAELDHDAWQKLRNNVPMTDNPKAAKMLSRAVTGDHVGILEYVQINGSMGTAIVVTPAEIMAKPIAKKVDEALALDDERIKDADRVSVEHVQVEEVQGAIAEKVAQAANGRQAKAAELWDIVMSSKDAAHRKAAAQDLLKFKKAAKVSWDKLGITQQQVETLLEVATADVTETAPAPGQMNQEDQAQQEAAVSAIAPVVEAVPETEDAAAAPAPAPANEGRQEKAARLLKVVKAKKGGKREAAQELLALKKSSKVSWERLGLTHADVDLVTKAAG